MTGFSTIIEGVSAFLSSFDKSSGSTTFDPSVADSVLPVEDKKGFLLRGGVGEPLVATFGLDMVCDEVRVESSLPIPRLSVLSSWVDGSSDCWLSTGTLLEGRFWSSISERKYKFSIPILICFQLHQHVF